MEKLTRRLRWVPGYDKRKKNYGVASARLSWEVSGAAGTLLLEIHLGHLPGSDARAWSPGGYSTGKGPYARGIFLHSRYPLGDAAWNPDDHPQPKCIYTHPNACYGSELGHELAEEVVMWMGDKPEEEIWVRLEGLYEKHLANAAQFDI